MRIGPPAGAGRRSAGRRALAAMALSAAPKTLLLGSGKPISGSSKEPQMKPFQEIRHSDRQSIAESGSAALGAV